MKKIILLLALFVSLSTLAQDCPGENVESLKNRTVKVITLSETLQRTGYKGFYDDADLKNVFKRTGKTTDYSALAGKEFKVISYERYTNRDGGTWCKLLLENATKDRLYYDYNPNDCSAFPFELMPEPEQPLDYCSFIKTKQNNKGIQYYQSKRTEGIMFLKYFDTESTINAIEVSTYLIKDTQKGVSILLSNNAKIERPEGKIVPSLVALRSGHLSIIVLTPEESELIRNNEIVKTTIGNIETKITKSATLKGFYNCIATKPTLPPPPPKYVLSCKDVVVDTKTIPGETTYTTPVIDGVLLKKLTGAKGATYWGSVSVPSETMRIGTGVMILFEDDYLINYADAKVIESKFDSNLYQYNAVFQIKDKDLIHFTTSKIKGVKVIDAVNPITEGTDIQTMAGCVFQK